MSFIRKCLCVDLGGGHVAMKKATKWMELTFLSMR